MKYAVVSDIHANIEAFEKVLKAIDRLQVDKIVCLGDTVGYYANPNECLEIFQKRNIQSVAGNHDRAGTGLKEVIAGCGVAGRRGIAWTRARLFLENKKFLNNLPLLDEVDGQFLMVHGSLYPAPNEEIYITRDMNTVRKNFDVLTSFQSKPKICFFGHTHHPVCYQYSGGKIFEIAPGEICLNTADYFLINPGSVGQSRDDDPRAAFLTYDTQTNAVHFYRVDYNRKACLAKARRAGLLYEESGFRSTVVRMLDKMGIKEFIKKGLRKR